MLFDICWNSRVQTVGNQIYLGMLLHVDSNRAYVLYICMVYICLLFINCFQTDNHNDISETNS